VLPLEETCLIQSKQENADLISGSQNVHIKQMLYPRILTSVPLISPYGCCPNENISHNVTPKLHTSLAFEKVPKLYDSGAYLGSIMKISISIFNISIE
jgi:hypothetical protein